MYTFSSFAIKNKRYILLKSEKKKMYLLPALQEESAVLGSCAVRGQSIVSDSWRPHGVQPSRLLCSWGFSRQEYWSGQPFPSPGNLPYPGIERRSPTLQADSLPAEPPVKPLLESQYLSNPGARLSAAGMQCLLCIQVTSIQAPLVSCDAMWGMLECLCLVHTFD